MKQKDASRLVLRNSQKRSFPYRFSTFDLEIEVHKGVFSPLHFNGWKIFTKNFPSVSGKEVLEIGCGCGITILNAAKKGANRAVALDINKKAVANTRKNAKLNGLEVAVYESDLFSALSKKERFDIIYWNFPFMLIDADYKYRSMLERALYDPGYKLLERFLVEAPNYLKNVGQVLLGFGGSGFR